jgi:hypothetical protein
MAKLSPSLPAVKGGAPVMQIGHTSGTKYGQNASAKVRGGNSTNTDQTIK